MKMRLEHDAGSDNSTDAGSGVRNPAGRQRASWQRAPLYAVAICLLATAGWPARAAMRHQAVTALRTQPPAAMPHPYGGQPQYRGQFGRNPGPRQQHLPQWFRQHRNLPLGDQERALRGEHGFNRLPPEKQQRLINRLRQLDAMPPARRERTLERMEAMERLSPDQRARVRGAAQRITEMPEPRRQMMMRAFQDLSAAPPGRRQGMLNSPQYKQQFSREEREMLATLMSVEPYTPASGPEYGGRR